MTLDFPEKLERQKVWAGWMSEFQSQPKEGKGIHSLRTEYWHRPELILKSNTVLGFYTHRPHSE